ncbi:complement decay-accelerating factor isoform X3 [Betta splendens]|uniref:Complement decay-accelerating factor isoform X3 n=1 Tax=Betta splendens TaxID=158456 RepID=A0A6P7MHE9_BETSP|nr:complement decay-accelerating factor isoform X3 [Betta splendens]
MKTLRFKTYVKTRMMTSSAERGSRSFSSHRWLRTGRTDGRTENPRVCLFNTSTPEAFREVFHRGGSLSGTGGTRVCLKTVGLKVAVGSGLLSLVLSSCSMDALLDHCGPTGAACLLFLYLHAFEAAAACLFPEGAEYTIVSDESLLLNDFPDGTTVILECANGYERESGSGSISCVDGMWTETDLQCKKIDCGPPRAQPHMSFDLSGGTLFTSLVRVICDEGYQISGSSFKKCYSTGWVGRAKCELIRCKKPPEVANSKNSWMSEGQPVYNDTIEYRCDQGFTLQGPDHITCSQYGQYDSQPPECSSVTTVEILTSQIITTTATSTSTTATPTTTQTRGASSSTDATAPRAETAPTSAVLHSEPEELSEAVDTNKNKKTGKTTLSSILVGGVGLAGSIVCFAMWSHKRKKGSANATAPI